MLFPTYYFDSGAHMRVCYVVLPAEHSIVYCALPIWLLQLLHKLRPLPPTCLPNANLLKHRRITSPQHTPAVFIMLSNSFGPMNEPLEGPAMAAFASFSPLMARWAPTESLRQRCAITLPVAGRRSPYASLAKPSQPTPAPAGDNYLQFTTATALKSFLTRRAVYTQASYYR